MRIRRTGNYDDMDIGEPNDLFHSRKCPGCGDRIYVLQYQCDACDERESREEAEVDA